MIIEGLKLDKEARHHEFGHVIAHADMYYGRTSEIPKIRKEEFFRMEELKNFKFGLPAFVLDFVDTMTGSTLCHDIQSLLRSHKIRDVMEVDKEYEDLCEKISDDFLPYTYYIFNKLGAIDF